MKIQQGSLKGKKKRKESVGSIAFSMNIYCSEVSDSECIIMA